MMYSNKIAMCLKVDGKVLREVADTVYLPFGQEYSIYIRNLNSLRALVSIEIDGTDIAEGTSFVVPANGTIEIERFVKSGNMDAGQRFKFIERTKKIEYGPRGIKAEDGLIRVQVEFERERPYINLPAVWDAQKTSILRGNPNGRPRGFDDGEFYATCSTVSCASASGEPQLMNAASPASFNDVGITVGGSVSEQKFETVGHFPTDGVKHVLVMRLLGETETVQITKPVTVKTVLTCPTCGTKSKVGSKFCKECATGLLIA